MQSRELKKGDIVQLRDGFNGFDICEIVVVTEPYHWGCRGYLASDDTMFVRPKWEDMEYVGRLTWTQGGCPFTKIDQLDEQSN